MGLIGETEEGVPWMKIAEEERELREALEPSGNPGRGLRRDWGFLFAAMNAGAVSARRPGNCDEEGQGQVFAAGSARRWREGLGVWAGGWRGARAEMGKGYGRR